MSTPLITKRSSRVWLWLLAGVAAVAAGWVWWQHSAGPLPDEQAAAPKTAASVSAWPVQAGPDGGASGPFISNEPVGDTRPPDFSEQDWQALNKALEKEPNKEKERNRLVSYLRFQRGVSKWSEMKDSPNVAERQALARELAAQLPSHVANGEVNSGEASMLLTAIATDLEPDPAKRQAWVETQRTQLQNTQTSEQAQALQEEKRKNEVFAAEQAELVAKWQQTPAQNRDPATLEAQLQALREKVYGTPTSR